MWRRSIAATAATAAVIALGAVAPAARAAGPGEAFYGDLDGDGLLDRARLGAAVRYCLVLVEIGQAQGGYLSPEEHRYRVPGRASSAVCPGLGVAVDLDPVATGDPGTAELVVGWFSGNPGQPRQDLLVLRNFTVSTTLDALRRPNMVGLADFDGDRRLDVYAWTDQGEGFATYLNPGIGTLLPGPVRFCARQQQYRLADFDQNGATDLVLAYVGRCDDGTHGVAVVLDDGTVTELRSAPDGGPGWTINVLYANRDRVPDIVVYHQQGGGLRTFLGVGNGTFVESPLAVRDTATVALAGSVRIPVLVNDSASRRAAVSIVVPPVYGTVEVTDGRTVEYRPGPVPDLTDQFVYRVTQDGHTSDATVVVKITS
ncbi:hypothetical protein I0C86_31575 [Plantactinospora sp. S1510]|uniref:VCBS repeat-containing protein n=1 Tax=Plantactinospora alkalitolerans TaxID=2789879 RepID=A0ABS0H4S8_9ACTN|nr:Ig-like domain-containing protein [Plantactinospora alkalitolerans]MBF9133466.1 hypothetical protein [Plantactinospora alkalitolerans]